MNLLYIKINQVIKRLFSSWLINFNHVFQLPLKRFPDSSVFSFIPNMVGVEGHPATKNSLQYPWVDS